MVSAASKYVPDRGEVAWITLDPQAGHEQAGRRPALILSPASYNLRAGLAVVVPITGQVKGYPFEVEIPSGLKVAGVALADQVRSVDWRARRASPICRLPAATVLDVQKRTVALVVGKG